MSDPISDAGYAMLGLGFAALLVTHVLLMVRKPVEICHEKASKQTSALASLNITAAALVSFGNIAVYRVVLAEQLLGVVLTPGIGHGPIAVVTTLIIAVALLQLLCANVALLGSGRAPTRPRCFAARGLLSIFFIVAILIGKLALGIVYYDPLPLCAVPSNGTATNYAWSRRT